MRRVLMGWFRPWKPRTDDKLYYEQTFEKISRPSNTPLPVSFDNAIRARSSTQRVMISSTLNQKSLSAFILVFACFMCLLVALLHLSDIRNGFSPFSSNPYILAYGPTAAMLLVVAFWRQIEYQCKSLMPWLELHRGNTAAPKTILLDYVSIFQAVSMWQSIANRHIPVCLAILGFITLKLIVVVSTGLLITTTSSISEMSLLNRLTSFDGTVYNVTSSIPYDFDQSVIYTTFAILAKNMSTPFGTSRSLAYDNFETGITDGNGSSITAEFGAVMPKFFCETVQVQAEFESNSTEKLLNSNMSIVSSNCTYSKLNLPYILNPQLYKCPNRQLSGLANSVSCLTSGSDNSSDSWVLYTMLDMRYQQTLNDTDGKVAFDGRVNTTSWSASVAAFTGILCRSEHSIGHVNVTFDPKALDRNVSVTDLAINPGLKLEGVTNSQIWDIVNKQLDNGGSMFGHADIYAPPEEYPDPLFKIISAVNGGGYESLLDPAVMSSAAEITLGTIAVQALNSLYRRQQNTTVPGSLAVARERLVINKISVWVMVAGFVIMICCTAGLIHVCPEIKEIMCEDSVSELTSLVSASKDTWPIMVDCLGAVEGSMETKLGKYQVLMLNQDDDEHQKQLVLQKLRPQSQFGLNVWPLTRSMSWGLPITVSRPVLGLSLSLPLISIILLEVLQFVSDSRFGFVSITQSTVLLDALYTHYLPSIFLLLVATLFNCLDFNAMLIAPYNHLRTGITWRSIQSQNLLGLFPLLALWRSARNLSIGTCFSFLAAFTGSFLTIVVSGLFTIQVITFPNTVALRRLDSFQLDWSSSAINDSGAAVLSSLVENLNFSYPRFTSVEIAIPQIQSPSDALSGQSDMSGTTFSVQVPVLRASLNCTEVLFPVANASISADRIQQHITFNMSYPLPPTCQLGGPDGNASTINIMSSINVPFNDTTTFVGRQIDLHVGPYDSIFGGSTDEVPSDMNADNPPGCPSLAFIYGFVNMSAAAEEIMNSISCQVCYQSMQEIPMNITFLNSDFVISNLSAPVPDESRKKYLTVNDQTSETAFQYRIQGHMTDSFALFSNSSGNPFAYYTFGQAPPIDTFFQGVLFGSKPLPLDTLKLDTNERRSQILLGIQSFYRRYMAQAISANMRVPLTVDTSTATQPTVSYTAIMPTGHRVRRIIQHRNPKIVLQSLLAFMFICGCVAVRYSSFSEILPAAANPCTIWGRMMLWAGSDFCDTERQRPSTVEKKGVSSSVLEVNDENSCHPGNCADDQMFKLGWWAKEDEHGVVRMRYGIDVVREEENRRNSVFHSGWL